MASKGRWKRTLKWVGIAVGALVVAAVVANVVLHRGRPSGRSGEAADALARRIERAVDVEAWERTGAVRWTFAGGRDHLWDRDRGFARVRWDDNEVLLRIGDRTGRAWADGREVTGDARDALLDEAHGVWTNDAFWLNPLGKLFDPGVTRELVEDEDGSEALLVTFGTGGRTPGDSYLWIVGDDGTPEAWRMWVSVLPIGGLRASWDGWITLSTGARVSTRHSAGPLSFELTNVEGAATLAELEPGADPFAKLSSR